jgi:type II secretory pathway pseudopilin PulG
VVTRTLISLAPLAAACALIGLRVLATARRRKRERLEQQRRTARLHLQQRVKALQAAERAEARMPAGHPETPGRPGWPETCAHGADYRDWEAELAGEEEASEA